MKPPDSAWAYYVSGNAHSAKGEFARAVQDLTRAIALDPDFIESYIQRGFNRIRIGEYDGAIADYNWALKHNVQNKARDYCDLSDAYRLKGDFDSALKKCNKAIEPNPSYNYPYQIRGRLSATSGGARCTVSWGNKSVPMPILTRQKHSKMQRVKAKDGINEYGDSN